MTVDNRLYTGRPADARIPKEERCYDLLDGLHIGYYRADHEHADIEHKGHQIAIRPVYEWSLGDIL